MLYCYYQNEMYNHNFFRLRFPLKEYSCQNGLTSQIKRNLNKGCIQINKTFERLKNFAYVNFIDCFISQAPVHIHRSNYLSHARLSQRDMRQTCVEQRAKFLGTILPYASLRVAALSPAPFHLGGGRRVRLHVGQPCAYQSFRANFAMTKQYWTTQLRLVNTPLLNQQIQCFLVIM